MRPLVLFFPPFFWGVSTDRRTHRTVDLCSTTLYPDTTIAAMSLRHPPRPSTTDFSALRRYHFTFHSMGSAARTAIVTDGQGTKHELVLFEAPMSVASAIKSMEERKDAVRSATPSQRAFEVSAGALPGQSASQQSADPQLSLGRDRRASTTTTRERGVRSLSPPGKDSRLRRDSLAERGRMRAQRVHSVNVLRYRPWSAREEAVEKSMSRRDMSRSLREGLLSWQDDGAGGGVHLAGGGRKESPPARASSAETQVEELAFTDAVTVAPAISSVPTRGQKRIAPVLRLHAVACLQHCMHAYVFLSFLSLLPCNIKFLGDRGSGDSLKS